MSNYTVSLGSSLGVAGLIAGIYAGASIVMRPASGFVSDRFDKKTLLVLSTLLFAVASFGCALTRSYILVGVFRALIGFAFAFKSALSISLTSLVVPREYCGSAVGWIGLAFTLSCAASPATAAIIAQFFGYPACFMSSGILFSAALVVIMTFKAPPSSHAHALSLSSDMDAVDADAQTSQVSHSTNSNSSTPKAPEGAGARLRTLFTRLFYVPAIPLMIVTALAMIAQGITVSLILLAGEMRGIEGMPYYFTMFALAAVCSKPLAGRISDKYGLAAVFIPLVLIESVAMVLLAFASSFLPVAIAGFCMGLGQGGSYSALQAESVRGVDEQHVGRAANTFYIGPDIGVCGGAFLGGIILQYLGPSAMFLAACAALLVSLALFLFIGNRRKRRMQDTTTQALQDCR